MALFGTAGIRGDATEFVTPRLALAVGRAVGIDALEHGVSEVVLGRDGRLTGPGLVAAVEAGLLSAGVDVMRVGSLPTPALAYSSRGRRGVMVTASHNPPADNGIKLFSDGVEFDSAAEHRIERRTEAADDPVEWSSWGRTTRVDVLDDYRRSVARYASRFGSGLDGCSVAVDCGNGMAAHATANVLEAAGADVTTVNGNVDGHFPARPSEPTRESLTEFSAFVGEDSYDVAFAHDGDADRVVVLDGDGSVVDADTIVAILAEHYVREHSTGEPVVVTTPNASARIDDRVSAAGGRTTRVALGSLHEGIADARDAGDSVAFAAEPGKHIHPAFGGWIDGIASAAVLARLVADAGSLDSLREPVVERPYRREQVACPDARKADAMTRVIERLPRQLSEASVDTDYGVRLDGPDGWWLLVRPSGTEPLVRIYAEGDDVQALVDTARSVVEDAVSGS